MHVTTLDQSRSSKPQNLKQKLVAMSNITGDGNLPFGSNVTIIGQRNTVAMTIGVVALTIVVLILFFFCATASIIGLAACCNSVQPTGARRRRLFWRSGAATAPDVEAEDGDHLGGLDEATLASFPKIVYVADESIVGGGDSCCTICLAEYMEKEELRVLPECGHKFHLQCLDPWLRRHSTCPVCRRASPAPSPLAEAAPPSSQFSALGAAIPV